MAKMIALLMVVALAAMAQGKPSEVEAVNMMHPAPAPPPPPPTTAKPTTEKPTTEKPTTEKPTTESTAEKIEEAAKAAWEARGTQVGNPTSPFKKRGGSHEFGGGHEGAGDMNHEGSGQYEQNRCHGGGHSEHRGRFSRGFGSWLNQFILWSTAEQKAWCMPKKSNCGGGKRATTVKPAATTTTPKPTTTTMNVTNPTGQCNQTDGDTVEQICATTCYDCVCGNSSYNTTCYAICKFLLTTTVQSGLCLSVVENGSGNDTFDQCAAAAWDNNLAPNTDYACGQACNCCDLNTNASVSCFEQCEQSAALTFLGGQCAQFLTIQNTEPGLLAFLQAYLPTITAAEVEAQDD